MEGATLSITVMTWLQVFILPHASVDFHVRLMVYACAQAPGMITSVEVIKGALSQLSFDVAVPVLAGSVLAVHSMVTLDGQFITGAMLSMTDMV